MKRLFCFCALLSCLTLDASLAQLSTVGWMQQRSGTRLKLHDVIMLDSLTAIAVGQYGTILKTTNAGLRWVQRSILPAVQPQPHWNAIAFGSPTVGVVVGDRGRGSITTDAGETWRNLFTIGTPVQSRNFLSVAFAGPNTIFVGNDSGLVLTSSNGGLTWQTHRFGSLPIVDMFFLRAINEPFYSGYVVTPRAAFFTLDDGMTWQQQQLPFWGLGFARRGDLTKSAIGMGPAYIVGADGDLTTVPSVLMRAQGDTTWRRWMVMPPIPAGIMNDVSASLPQTAYTCGMIRLATVSSGGAGIVYKSTNGGNFWAIQHGFRRGLNAIDFFNERRGFTVGDSGAIYFTASGGGRVVNAFRLISPRDGDSLRVGTTIRFQWERALDLDPDTTWYQVLLSADGGESWQVVGGSVDTISSLFTVPTQGTYSWTVRASDGANLIPSEDSFVFVTRTTVGGGSQETPNKFALYQNYPNPFNPTTAISYEIGSPSLVSLKVFDLLGKEVATLVNVTQNVGSHSVRFDASKLSSGIYIYRMQAGNFIASRKLVLMR